MSFDVDKHIKFELAGEKNKTKVWRVVNTFNGREVIGWIRWYSAWRHYCFFPAPSSVFSDRCLEKIGEFVKKRNKGE